ncbi:MAG: phosphopentomutase [Myxococcota bacterium]
MSESNSKRALLLVLDSVGIGEAPDAAEFGDVGSNTVGHIAETVDGFEMPRMRRLGFGNIDEFEQMDPVDHPAANFGRMQEVAPGKDTTSGHWEFAGLVMDEGFRTFPDGFGDDIIEPFCEAIGVDGVLGNKPESGTVIIKELGKEHVATGKPIVYTSADPVFQIAAHEDVVPVEKLYEWCKAAYDIVTPRGISRVIARPFVGQWPDYTRTSRRKDFSVPPPRETVLERLSDNGVHVTAVGKIGNIYASRGCDTEIKTENNDHGVEVTLDCIRERDGLIFTNLVDFDSKFGHRRNPEGYARALMRFDQQVDQIIDALDDGDLLIITADHGNDPTYTGTDHTREYVPLLTMVKGGKRGVNLGTRSTFADVGRTIADHFDVEWDEGTSFLADIR